MVDEQVKKMWPRYRGVLFSYKEEEILLSDLEGIMLSEIVQTQKDKLRGIPYTWNPKNQTQRVERSRGWKVGCPRLEAGNEERFVQKCKPTALR